MEGLPMLKLPIRTWISNAAAVFWGQHGAVTEQAEQSQCSRETVYQHARKVEERLEAGIARPNSDRGTGRPDRAARAKGRRIGSRSAMRDDP